MSCIIIVVIGLVRQKPAKGSINLPHQITVAKDSRAYLDGVVPGL